VSEPFASDIVIKLMFKGEAHVLSFQHALAREPFEIALLNWQDRVTKFREKLPGRLDPLRKLIGRARLNDSQIVQAVDRIERVAHGLLEQLLEGSAESSETMPRLAKFLEPVFRAATRTPIVEIEASSADQLIWQIPFEFFPLAPDPEPLLTPRDRFERFLGFRAEIVRCVRGGPSRIDPDPTGRLPVQVFAFEDDEYKGIQEQLHYLRNNATVLSEWPIGDAVSDTSAAVTEFIRRLLSLPKSSSADGIGCVVHLSCHYSGGDLRTDPYLDFGKCADDAPLTITVFDLQGEISRQRVGIPGTPQFAALFFLNACETAASDTRTETLIGFVRKHNATAIIASEGLLPDPLAGEFAVRLYRELLLNKPVSAAVFTARRHLLDRRANPVGLFYTLFGNPMLCLRSPS
jgi:hypothetical protein